MRKSTCSQQDRSSLGKPHLIWGNVVIGQSSGRALLQAVGSSRCWQITGPIPRHVQIKET